MSLSSKTVDNQISSIPTEVGLLTSIEYLYLRKSITNFNQNFNKHMLACFFNKIFFLSKILMQLHQQYQVRLDC